MGQHSTKPQRGVVFAQFRRRFRTKKRKPSSSRSRGSRAGSRSVSKSASKSKSRSKRKVLDEAKEDVSSPRSNPKSPLYADKPAADRGARKSTSKSNRGAKLISKTKPKAQPLTMPRARAAAFAGTLEDYWVFEASDINKDYKLGEQFSRGHSGHVFSARHKASNELRAVKMIFKPRFSRQRSKTVFFDALCNEVAVLRNVDHEHVVKLFDVYEDDRHIYLVMEMLSGGELFEEIQRQGRLSEKDASKILRQITEAIEYMHNQKIAHCDVKPENLLFAKKGNTDTIKIVDFGMSKALRWRQYFRCLCGTPYYVAPEVLRGHYDEACDMWSIGVIMFVLLFGFPPFYSHEKDRDSNKVIYRKVAKGFEPVVKEGYGPWFPSSMEISDSARDLISQLLVMDVADRMTSSEALAHPWLKGETATEEALDDEVFRSMTRFSQDVMFKQVVTDVMIETLSPDQVEALSQAFQKMDKNKDGMISMNELKQCLSEIGKDMRESKVFKIIKELDLDGDGRINYEELVHARMFRKLAGKETRLWQAFRRMDANNDGRISPDELLASISGEGAELAHAKILISELDLDGDGNVNYEEFIRVWEKDVERHRHSATIDYSVSTSMALASASPRGSIAEQTKAKEQPNIAPASGDDELESTK